MTTKTPEEVIADITAAYPEALMPADLRDKLTAFYRDYRMEAGCFRIALLVCAMDWIKGLAERTGDRDVADRVAAIEMTFASAIVLRSLKMRLGEKMSAARFALVAYDIGEQAAELPGFEETVNGVRELVEATE